MNILIRTLYFYYFFFFWLLSWNDFYEHLERLVLSEENFHFKEYMLELMEIHFIFVEILDWQISVDLSPHIWIAILVKWSKTQHCCLQRRLAVHLVLVYLSTADKVYILCRCLNPQPTLCNLPATCRTSLHNQATYTTERSQVMDLSIPPSLHVFFKISFYVACDAYTFMIII